MKKLLSLWVIIPLWIAAIVLIAISVEWNGRLGILADQMTAPTNELSQSMDQAWLILGIAVLLGLVAAVLSVLKIVEKDKKHLDRVQN